MFQYKYLIKVYSSLRNYISFKGYLWKYFVYIQEKCSHLATLFLYDDALKKSKH